MEACLKAGTHYTDMGGLFHWAKKQLAMSDRFEAAGLTAVCGSGLGARHRQRHGTLRLPAPRHGRVGAHHGRHRQLGAPAAPLVAPYSLDTILNEFLMSAWPFEDGDWKEYAPFQGAEEVDFPEPVGTQTCYYTIHSEPYTIPVAFKDKGIRECSFKLALPKVFEQKLRFLCDLGAAATEAIEVKGAPVVPRDVVIEFVERSLEAAPVGKAEPSSTTTRCCASTCAAPRTARCRTGAWRACCTSTRSGGCRAARSRWATRQPSRHGCWDAEP